VADGEIRFQACLHVEVGLAGIQHQRWDRGPASGLAGRAQDGADDPSGRQRHPYDGDDPVGHGESRQRTPPEQPEPLLRFDVQRGSYAKPARVTEVFSEAGRPAVRRPLPGWAEAGWLRLHHFPRMTVRNLAGKIMANRLLGFCPDSFDPQRTGPLSPSSQPFPSQCLFNPFQFCARPQARRPPAGRCPATRRPSRL